MNNKFTINNGSCRIGSAAFARNSAHMLPVVDYLSDLSDNTAVTDLVEVQFKHTRKVYYHNVNNLPLVKGTKVAVEASPGHDIGEVTLTGRLVEKQIAKLHLDLSRYEIRQVYRIATDQDMERAREAHAKEHETMIKARQLARDLGLEMKIGDVEYQGDGSKAIFYYIADGRVDFRQLIKVYAEQFRVRIEMKQIGARQEAGRIGGTGPCGRELCCSTWMTQFNSVGTAASKIQNIGPNPQKLAGQCAKLKCCLNYELAQYEEAVQKLPARNIHLETKDATYYYFSADPLAQMVTYSTELFKPIGLQQITVEEANRIIALNREGKKPDSLGGKQTNVVAEVGFLNVVGQDEINRFDKHKKTARNNGRNDNQAKHEHKGHHNDRRNHRDGGNKPK